MVWFLIAGAAVAVGAAIYCSKSSRSQGAFVYLPTHDIIDHIESAEELKEFKKKLWTASTTAKSADGSKDYTPDVDPTVVEGILLASGLDATSLTAQATIANAAGQIQRLTNLLATLEARRSEAYDANNAAHEAQLQQLWDLMMPGTPLPARVHAAWGKLGFQGNDPATDFRGGGLLGLDSLLGLARRYPTLARSVATIGDEEGTRWFSYAITVINIAFETLRLSRAAHRFYGHHGYSQEAFVDLCAIVLTALQRRWRTDKPPNVMSFGQIFPAALAEVRAAVTAPGESVECVPDVAI